MLDDAVISYWIWLVMIMGVANKRTMELVKEYPNIEALCHMLCDPDNEILKEKEYQKVIETPFSSAKQILDSCRKNGIGIITWGSAYYPKHLRNIYNAPAILFYKGNLEILQTEEIITIVGTRNPSNYSISTGERLCMEIAQQDIMIASGGALGMDSVAHNSAIMAGKPTIAVMACGLDFDYPKDNRALRAKICETGVMISEYFPGTPAYSRNFPVRNRILSGISKGTLVLEASEKSGTIITANHACEQNRTVFCLPPTNIFDKRYAGQANLLRDGATPVFSAEDVLEIKNYQIYEPLPKPEKKRNLKKEKNNFSSESEKKEKSESISVYQMPPEATSEQQKILELLKESGKNINMLCQLTEMHFDILSTNLVEMEMQGWIINTGMDCYQLADNLK
ncbi:MAG: DNA-processing protein DprA [Oscillospiraceae bacterium]|nr:DNA-processing protein DprA [Oscillospiraceae bacterium]